MNHAVLKAAGERNKNMGELICEFIQSTGFYHLTLPDLAMIGIACGLLYLGIVRKYEPLLLVPISFGMLLVNLPLAGLVQPEEPGIIGGLLNYLSFGLDKGIYPPLIFLGIGALTDFGPLIANPVTLLLGAAAQFGIFTTFAGAYFLGFTATQSGAIGIIGGADGPTAIFVAGRLAPELLGSIAIAAYSYMALVPIIQPPIMKLLTTRKEREVVMKQLRPVPKTVKIIFPIAVIIISGLLLPSAVPLLGMLMFGNLLRESGVTERLSRTAQTELNNIIVIFLGLSVGAKATAELFLTWNTILIIVLGLTAFAVGTAGGVLMGKLLYLITGGRINPLIGSAGVSAVPMAARVSQTLGKEANPKNYLLMHAMGPNVAGVIGSAVAAGIILSLFG